MGSPSYLKVTKIDPEFALYGDIHTIFNKIYLVLACVKGIGKPFFGFPVKLAILYCHHLLKYNLLKYK